jgi:hypothetical protein
MNNSIYAINKGINKPIVFKGVSGQYIYYLAGGLLGLLLLFAMLYMAKINTYACMVIILAAGTLLITTISRLSRKYGQYGLMKRQAVLRLPAYLWFNSRKLFTELKFFKGVHESANAKLFTQLKKI